VEEITIRPTTKFIKIGAIAAAVVFLALEVLVFIEYPKTRWLMALPPVILLWPLSRWMRRGMAKAVIGGDRLRYETGFAAKSTRTIQLHKVQDVRVDQRMSQRIFGVGDVSIETAGEASRLTLHNVDHPQALAEEILDRAHQTAPGGTSANP
jgi:uncharacterized membrane protein YdbT with pleckstrin-like domain